jgi:hypothetical protein
MRSRISRVSIWCMTAGVAFAAAGCSSDPVSPAADARAGTPSLSVGTTTPPSGSTTLDVFSGSSTQYCGYATPLDGSTNPSGSCVNSFDLTGVLAGSPGNPGWGAPVAGSAWIGAQANANEYRVPTGTYAFETTFNVPAGSTGRGLNITLKADNNTIVFLNGTEIGRHDPAGDIADHWTGTLGLTDGGALIHDGANTLRILLTNTRVAPNAFDANVPCPLPQPGFQYAGYDQAVCLNPSALSFAAQAFFTPAPPPAQYAFVVGDVTYDGVGDHQYFWGAQWWKNNEMSGAVDKGVAGFKGFAVLVNGSCGSTWQSLPGNSSNPPENIGDIVTIIVTSTVTKSGNVYAGNIVRIAHVNQDGNYADNPGHEGQGPVVDEVCPSAE